MSEETFIESTYIYIFDARLYELMRSLDSLFSAGSARYRERRDQMEEVFTMESVTPEQFQQQVCATILFTSVIYTAQQMGLEIPKDLLEIPQDLGEIVRDPLIKLN